MDLVTTILALIVALTIHEFAHAYIAEYLGDPTARLKGRLTLNPLSHLDPVGSAVFIITLSTSLATNSNFVFGWGKPVPIDPFNLRNPRRDSGLVAAAGPASNFITALIVAIIIRLLIPVSQSLPFFQEFIFPFLGALMSISVFLGVFNLIPLHPLDGGKILTGFLPAEPAQIINKYLNRYGLIVLIAILVFNLVDIIIYPISQFMLSILLGISTFGIS